MYSTFFYKLNNDGTANATWLELGNRKSIFGPVKPLDFPEELNALNQNDLDMQVKTMLVNNQQCSLNTWAQLLVAHTKESVETDAVSLLSIITAVRILEITKEILEQAVEKQQAAVDEKRKTLSDALNHTSGAEHFQIQQELHSLKDPVLELPFSTENLSYWSTWVRQQKLMVNELPDHVTTVFKNLETKHVIDGIKTIHHAGGFMTLLNDIEETYDATIIGPSAKRDQLHKYTTHAQPPEGQAYGIQTGTLTELKFQEEKPEMDPDEDSIGSLLEPAEDEVKEPPIPEEEKTNPRNIFVSTAYFLNAFGELTIQSDNRLQDSLQWFNERVLKYRANPKPDLNAVQDLVEQCLRYGTSKLELAENELKKAKRQGGELAQDICSMLYNRPWIEVLGQLKAFDVLGTAVDSEAKELFKQFRLYKNVNQQLGLGQNTNNDDFEAGNLF